jgi:hypothetical protein
MTEFDRLQRVSDELRQAQERARAVRFKRNAASVKEELEDADEARQILADAVSSAIARLNVAIAKARGASE